MMPGGEYPAELVQVARRVVWYDDPEQALSDLTTFRAHLRVYGSAAGLAVVAAFIPELELRRVLEQPAAGVFTEEAWRRWHEHFWKVEARSAKPHSTSYKRSAVNRRVVGSNPT